MADTNMQTTASSPPPSSVAASAAVSSAEPAPKRVVLPRCAAWFALDAISSLEKRLLPEFFEHDALHRTQFPPGAKLPSSKTPQIYMKYRNYMVHAYRQQPHVYLTATACRRNLAGDACAIMRVHEFLTHWGVINYDVPPHAMPPAVAANYALKPSAASLSSSTPLAVLGGGHGAVNGVSHTPQTPSGDTWQPCERCGGGDVAFELTPDAKRKVTAEHNGALPLTGFCLRPGSGVCDDCYLARSLPDGVEPTDFVRVQRKPQWSSEEDAKLLDAVSSSTASGPQQEALDWNSIAAKVQTKSADECVVRFLELPLLPRVQESGGSNAAPSFAYAPSVNASVVDMAALVRDVDPFVAKAAARAAIQAIQDLHKQPPREVVAAKQQQTNGVVKEETPSVVAVPDKKDESGDVEMVETNGSATEATDAKTDVEAAAAAVTSAGDAAGIVAIKTEPNGTTPATADVEMATSSTDAVASPSKPEESVQTTKETLAVVQEAAHATAAALLASKAHAIAQETARGPARDLMTQLLQNQLEQLELKMQQVNVLEKALATEKESLTRERHALYMDRLAFAQLKLNGGNTASL